MTNKDKEELSTLNTVLITSAITAFIVLILSPLNTWISINIYLWIVDSYVESEVQNTNNRY